MLLEPPIRQRMNHTPASKDKYLKGDFLGDDLRHGHGRRPLREGCVLRKKLEATISFGLRI